jgi:hypothetical protein
VAPLIARPAAAATQCFLVPARFCYAARFPLARHESMELPFNERGVSVTRTALSVAGQVIALRDVEDLRIVTVGRNRVVPWLLSLAGVAGFAGGLGFGSSVAIVCGAMMIVVGWLTWITQDVSYRLIVVTGGKPGEAREEREALSSLDREFVERVAGVIRDATAGKGDAASRAAP